MKDIDIFIFITLSLIGFWLIGFFIGNKQVQQLNKNNESEVRSLCQQCLEGLQLKP